MSSRIAVIDTGTGNLFSLKKFLSGMKPAVDIKSDIKEIAKADKIIIPGVGHFQTAMNHLSGSGVLDILNEMVLVKKKPVLGICLGLQIMAKVSEEGQYPGLSWLDAKVVRLKVEDKYRYKIPHICWNQIIKKKSISLLDGIAQDSSFYFLHSYYVQPENDSIVAATTCYENEFPSVINSGNIFGVQFHPEKSHCAGFHLLNNFIKQ